MYLYDPNGPANGHSDPGLIYNEAISTGDPYKKYIYIAVVQMVARLRNVFFVFLDKRSELSCSLCKCVQKLEETSNICKPIRKSVRTCKDYVISMEIATLLNSLIPRVLSLP